MFGEDYYIEIQRHGIKEQDKVNELLLKFAIKHNVKVIASNDSHYTDQDDYNAHIKKMNRLKRYPQMNVETKKEKKVIVIIVSIFRTR